MKSPNLGLLPHSLGHTSTGKLILDQIGSVSQLRTSCIKWTRKDHLEAVQVIQEKIKKGHFSKYLMKNADGSFNIGHSFSLMESNDVNHINYIVEVHQEFAKIKKS